MWMCACLCFRMRWCCTWWLLLFLCMMSPYSSNRLSLYISVYLPLSLWCPTTPHPSLSSSRPRDMLSPLRARCFHCVVVVLCPELSAVCLSCHQVCVAVRDPGWETCVDNFIHSLHFIDIASISSIQKLHEGAPHCTLENYFPSDRHGLKGLDLPLVMQMAPVTQWRLWRNGGAQVESRSIISGEGFYEF